MMLRWTPQILTRVGALTIRVRPRVWLKVKNRAYTHNGWQGRAVPPSTAVTDLGTTPYHRPALA
jgi:hypothetical protein